MNRDPAMQFAYAKLSHEGIPVVVEVSAADRPMAAGGKHDLMKGKPVVRKAHFVAKPVVMAAL